MFFSNRFSSYSDLSHWIKTRFIWRYWRGDWVLGRHACLGQDVYRLSGIKLPVFNIQKGRIDYLMDVLSDKKKKIKASIFNQHISRLDVAPLMRQLENFDRLPRTPPVFIYMDSFSELVDQLFVSRKEGWGASCVYSDINHTEKFEKNYLYGGLLNLENSIILYRIFFDKLISIYGQVPIIFLHFPSNLETRDLYITRAANIKNSIDMLALEYKNLISISIHPGDVERPENPPAGMESFPYHFNSRVYINFCDKFLKSLKSLSL